MTPAHQKDSVIQLAPKLELPLEVVTERLAFMGQSGSGKTYAAMRLAELMLEVGAQIVALDPVGPWWGLRAAADGKAPGFPVVVFGGIHGDVPITPRSGALVADVIVDKGVSAVVDVSDFTVGEMHTFVVEFAERFFDRKKREPTPVHLFLEEAHTFVPQQLPPDQKAALMLHRVERIVRVGRNHGIGSSLISQMPQSVNKKALNQAGTLFAMRTLGKNERKAIKEWMADKATGEEQLDLDAQLKTLETGEAWVASPHWLKLFLKTRVSRKVTFDSSATPKFGVRLEPPKVLAPVDVQAFREAMQEAVDRAEKENVGALQKRIRDLEAQLRKAQTSAAAPPPPAPAMDLDDVRRRIDELRDAVDRAAPPRRGGHVVSVGPGKPLPDRRAPRVPPAAAPPRSPAPSSTAAAAGLRAGERKMLEVLARGHPVRRTVAQLGTLAGFTPSGGTFRTYERNLRRLGLIAVDGREVAITDEGLAAVGDPGLLTPQTTEEILAMWRGALRAGERAMLDALVKIHPDSMSLGALGGMTGFAVTGGTFRTYLRTLVRNGLAVVEGDQVRAGDALFS